VADAVAVALAMQEALAAGRAPQPGWAAGRGIPEKWGRARPSPRVEAEFTPWLAGVARGMREADAPAEARAALRALEALGAR
jgi:hypothetical protein